MDWKRTFRHLLMPTWRVYTVFSPRVLQAIENAIRDSETTHDGQIRFVVEAALDVLPLLRGVEARQRALDVFSMLRVWDTEHNNGVLIYLLLADHDVEIVADRGLHAHVGTQEWGRICHAMEVRFRAGEFQDGVLAGIQAVGAHLVHHYPGGGTRVNELPDAPTVLR
jgi:uncharacterized membrane protein